MITKYMTSKYRLQIKKCEFDKETPLSLMRNNRRTAKITQHEKYHDSFKDAKQYLKERSILNRNWLKGQLEAAERTIINAEELTEESVKS
jgi:hypothetical protein